MQVNQIIQHNAMEKWPVPESFFRCIVTSPPYYLLRNYKHPDQIGTEKTPGEYIGKLCECVFTEARRTLMADGTLWVNIGDTYDKNKNLIGIPWLFAFAMKEKGWILRQDIIWNKPNPMPEATKDRCTRAHEYLFMFTKNLKYYYDYEAIKTPAVVHSLNPSHFSDGTKKNHMNNQRGKTDKQRGHSRRHAGFNERWDKMTLAEQQSKGANKRSVWTVAPANFEDAHFATFPPDLIVDCIKAGSKIGDNVGDPFFGSGTTGEVARKLERNFIGLELNPDYISISKNRLQKSLGLFI